MNQLTGDGLKNINEWIASKSKDPLVADLTAVSYTHLRAHET